MVNPARTRTVQNVLQNPGTGTPMVGQRVSIRLNVPGFVNGGAVEKVRTRYATTDATGLWSVVLEVNADVDPAGTSYTVHEVSGIAWTFIVPAGSGTVNLRDILVVSPTNPDPMVAGVPLPGSSVPANYVWTTDGAGGGDYAAEAGGAGAVSSVFTRTGAVVAASGDYAAFYDALGAAAAAQAAAVAASQPLDSDLTAIAALATTTFGRSVLTQADAAALRTLAGLGTAATQASTAFDAAGAASTAQSAAIAAAATDATTKANAAQAASQPLDSDLTAIAALATTSFGRSFLALADAAAGRTLLGLGTLATQSGTFSGTSSGTNTGDQDLSALAPKASPALTGSPTVPTATPGTNTTQAASTAYADAAVLVERTRALAAEAAINPLGSVLYLAANYR